MALYLRMGATPEDLRSWSVWERVYHEALHRLEEPGRAPELPVTPIPASISEAPAAGEEKASYRGPTPESARPQVPQRRQFKKKMPAPPEPDYYQVLGVSPQASVEEIKLAYEQRAMELATRPGHNAKARWRELEEAYVILSNPQQRADYDALRAHEYG